MPPMPYQTFVKRCRSNYMAIRIWNTPITGDFFSRLLAITRIIQNHHNKNVFTKNKYLLEFRETIKKIGVGELIVHGDTKYSLTNSPRYNDSGYVDIL